MAFSTLLPLLFSSFLFISLANAVTFNVVNKCSYTVWAAGYPGGGKQLDSGQSWTIDVPAGTAGGRVWGRTGCNFDSNGNGNCQSGDCGKLVCSGYGSPPNTLAEYTLGNQEVQDSNDISLVDGFNIPMNFVPTDASGCTRAGDHCSADVNAQCPNELKTAGGCLNPCQVYKTNEYCCTNGPGTCGPTTYSQYFKSKCPEAYSYPQDDKSSIFSCPSGKNYDVVFCP